MINKQGYTTIDTAIMYNKKSTQETCYIMSVSKTKCMTNCNCLHQSTCHTCYKDAYQYTVLTSKCGNKYYINISRWMRIWKEI